MMLSDSPLNAPGSSCPDATLHFSMCSRSVQRMSEELCRLLTMGLLPGGHALRGTHLLLPAMAFMALRFADACSSDWPPERKWTPAQRKRTSLRCHRCQHQMSAHHATAVCGAWRLASGQPLRADQYGQRCGAATGAWRLLLHGEAL
jgi:hypothetical protein